MEEAVDILLGARERIGRCVLWMPDRSSNWGPMPTLPISVPVRSMDETARSRGGGISELAARDAGLPDMRLKADALEARDMRPPPLASCSESGILSLMREFAEKRKASRRCTQGESDAVTLVALLIAEL
jgi:hypothetical protein